MKYLKQWMLILIFTLLGELLKAILPFQIPAGIYGLILMFFCLWSGILRKDQIQETAGFLLHMCAEHGTNLTGASPVTGIYRQV